MPLGQKAIGPERYRLCDDPGEEETVMVKNLARENPTNELLLVPYALPACLHPNATMAKSRPDRIIVDRLRVEDEVGDSSNS